MPSLTEAASGVFVIAVTPFTENGNLDLDSIDQMVSFYLERGADGLTVLGMMGEAPKLTMEESKQFVRRVLAAVGKNIPVVVGVSSPGFAAMHELTESVMGDGAAGVMIAPAPGLKSDDQIYSYFELAAEVLGQEVPFVLQDFPLSSGVMIAPSVILKIVNAISNCVLLKHEDWPGLAKISALRWSSDHGESRRISILCGNGGLFLPEELARGADGVMTGFAFPEMMRDVYRAHVAGDAAAARNIFDAYLPLARYEQQPGIGLLIRKYLLAQRGAIACPYARNPAPRLSSNDVAEINELVFRQQRKLESLALTLD